MPHPWAMVDANFPTFTGDENPKEQVRQIVDYMMLLTEALKYILENLDKSNWNSAAMTAFQNDTTKEVEGQTETIGGEMVSLEQKITDLAAKVETLEGLIQADEDGNVTLGKEGKSINLIGSVYLNGTLME